ncbi:MAG: hypothetical protein ACFCVG_12920 [Kineosporiaceae bacterium]
MTPLAPLLAPAIDTTAGMAAAAPAALVEGATAAVSDAASGALADLAAAVLPVAVVAGCLALAGYALACWVRPVAACRTCDGNGRVRTPSGRAWLRCNACDGGGARIRTGRRAFNTSRRVRRDAAHLSHHDQGQRLAHIPTAPEHQPTAHRPRGRSSRC